MLETDRSAIYNVNHKREGREVNEGTFSTSACGQRTTVESENPFLSLIM